MLHIRLAVCFFALLICNASEAGDWPTYLHDATRNGMSADSLPPKLQLQWTRLAAGSPRRAWEGPRETPIEGLVMKHRVAFDDAHHVAVVGKRLYYGSMIDHHFYCVDTESGKAIWTFATEGSIRLAPTIESGRVYFGSDDGLVYCLKADSGEVVWKHRVGPKDERLLARGSITGRWPVRTGVLVQDGIAYFGGGVFPHEKVFLVAVEAATGKVIWKNGAISERDAGRDDLSPQGYLLANEQFLFVPSGRSLPAAFNRKTGEYEYKRTYGWRNTAGGVVGGAKALLSDGQLFSFGAHHMLALDQQTGDAGHAYVGGRQMTVRDKFAYIANGENLIAVDRAAHTAASRERQKLFVKRRGVRSDAKQVAEIDKQMAELATVGVLWRAPFKGDSSLISTENLVIAGGIGEATAWNRATGEQVWSEKLTGEARGLAVADDALFVSSTDGSIHCFREAVRDRKTIIRAARPGSPYADDKLSAVYASAVESILKETNARDGFCLVLGGEQGRLAYELANRSKLQIYAVESDIEKVRTARRALKQAGLYGKRIVFVHSESTETPLPNYFANLVVSDTALLTGKLPLSSNELGRYVKPCGGKVCVGSPSKTPAADLAKSLGETYLRDDAKISTSGDWALLTRGKLPGAGDWSHQYGNVSNTSFTKDYRVKGSLGVLWYGDPGPSQMINRHQAASAPLTTNGRFFIQGTDNVRAFDAYNGLFLWEYENPGAIRTGVFNNHETSNLAATDDDLFVVVNEVCTRLDAATGKLVRQYKAPQADDGVERKWGYVAVDDGLLYGTSTVRTELAASLRRRGRTIGAETDGLFAVDLNTHQQLWKYTAKNLMHVTIALGDGHIYFVESTITQEERDRLLRQDKAELRKLKGEAAKKKEAELKALDVRRAVCLNARTGEKIWSKPIDVTNVSGVSSGGGNICLMYHDGHVVICGANANGHYWNQFLSGQFSQRRILVLKAADGEKIWSKDANYMNRPVMVNDQIIAEPWSFEVATGEEKQRVHPITGAETKWQFSRPGHHCGIITATPNMMLFRSGFIGYYDMYEDSGTRHFSGQRLGCWVNAIPGNGLVVIPEASAGCVCLFSIASTVVLEPREDRGPAWGIYSAAGPTTPVKRLAINLGAPGDRRDKQGNLWLGFPRPKTVGRMEFVFNIAPKLAKGGRYYARNSESIEFTDATTPWLLSSGAEGLTKFELPLLGEKDAAAFYKVRLHFAELDERQAGDRVFDIKLQGETVAANVDVAKEAGRLANLVKTFGGISVAAKLQVELVPHGKTSPILSAIDVELEQP
ncbi:MAG: PQQ-binding-like beta-propeller repeat protein [Pirellulaceae bacterium]|jgi:outer membrane protein assembly factor BamB|nr:PQQ-binding-like beta-propeller repeat protein [Pirellulaceae bacterium]MDP7017444.1 PQQ-binding-like beta-propeller repeat protein [Pirellulaceae bacterium]